MKCSVEIEDLSNAGSFDDQPHSLGPTLFYNPGEEEGRRRGREPQKALATTKGRRCAGDGALVKCRRPVWTHRRHLRHGTEIPRFTLILRAAVSQYQRSPRVRGGRFLFALTGHAKHRHLVQSHGDQGSLVQRQAAAFRNGIATAAIRLTCVRGKWVSPPAARRRWRSAPMAANGFAQRCPRSSSADQ